MQIPKKLKRKPPKPLGNKDFPIAYLDKFSVPFNFDKDNCVYTQVKIMIHNEDNPRKLRKLAGWLMCAADYLDACEAYNEKEEKNNNRKLQPRNGSKISN